MIFKIRPDVKKQFDTVHDFSIKNLIVSGCSFTYNNHASAAVTWPYYLKDLGGFSQVLDSSLPGAGNFHISNSLLWSLENDRPDPADSLVIVMWSGCDRDDYICPEDSNTKKYPFEFRYSKNIISAITGGTHPEANGNVVGSFKDFSQTKTPESRAIENYLYIVSTQNYLKAMGYKFLFLNFLSSRLPSRSYHFDIALYLDTNIKKNLNQMIAKITDPYTWAVKNDQLCADNYHPSPDGHLSWTKNVLIPHLKTLPI